MCILNKATIIYITIEKNTQFSHDTTTIANNNNNNNNNKKFQYYKTKNSQ